MVLERNPTRKHLLIEWWREEEFWNIFIRDWNDLCCNGGEKVNQLPLVASPVWSSSFRSFLLT
ncbi:hypothetical protein NC651_036797 [Populus alba x Populus x berolinensis]|nr:hypothetical protein NC651_036797 [Populus alba x Populus x berolinensis]